MADTILNMSHIGGLDSPGNQMGVKRIDLSNWQVRNNGMAFAHV